MIDRRGFLGSVLALAGLDAPPPLAADASARREAEALGIPRRRSLVAAGFHPLAPERVVVVDGDQLERYARRHRPLKRRLREEETRLRALFPEHPLPPAKVDLIAGLMDRLTDHYRRPDLVERWTRTLFRREILGSTGLGHGLGLLHDFQAHDTPVRTTNGVVDWCLIVLPGGTDWQAIDGRPVHFMVGPVRERCQPGTYMRVTCAITQSLRPLLMADGFDPAAWGGTVVAAGPADAAREVNGEIRRGFEGADAR